jgi:hypothetical protein
MAAEPPVHRGRPKIEHQREVAMGFEVTGLFGLIVLVVDIYAIVKTVQSSAETGSKVLWIVIILILPLLGAILWLLMGPRGASR